MVLYFIFINMNLPCIWRTDERQVLFVRQKYLRCHTHKDTKGAFERSYSEIRMRRNLSRIFSIAKFWSFEVLHSSNPYISTQRMNFYRTRPKPLNIVFIVESFKTGKEGWGSLVLTFFPLRRWLFEACWNKKSVVCSKKVPLPLYQLVTTTVCCTDYTPAPSIVSPSFNSSL